MVQMPFSPAYFFEGGAFPGWSGRSSSSSYPESTEGMWWGWSDEA